MHTYDRYSLESTKEFLEFVSKVMKALDGSILKHIFVSNLLSGKREGALSNNMRNFFSLIPHTQLNVTVEILMEYNF